jgi:hypothetical protein
MRILATIPALATEAEPGGEATGTDGTRTSAGTVVVRRQSRPFPVRSIVVLAAMAIVAWSLAHWNDARRLRHQEAAKLADRPPAAALEAVLR